VIDTTDPYPEFPEMQLADVKTAAADVQKTIADARTLVAEIAVVVADLVAIARIFTGTPTPPV
jgi:hypothetical protein